MNKEKPTEKQKQMVKQKPNENKKQMINLNGCVDVKCLL